MLVCACSTPTQTTLSDFDPKGPAYMTPDGYFMVYAHNWGEVTQEHLSMADGRWKEVSQCLGFDPERLQYYPFLLEKVPFACGDFKGAAGCHHDYGHDYRGHIAAIGGLDFIPGWSEEPRNRQRWELERIWGHEMIHQIFVFLYGHNDSKHERLNDWECQYPKWGKRYLTEHKNHCII